MRGDSKSRGASRAKQITKMNSLTDQATQVLAAIDAELAKEGK